MWQNWETWMAVERNRTRASRWVMSVYALFLVNWLVAFRLPWGYLRFTSPAANCLTLAFALLLPFVAMILLLPLKGVGKALGFAGLVVLSLFSLALWAIIFVAVLPGEWAHGNDPSFEFVRQVKRVGPAVRVYRTDEGAWSSFGIVVQQETTLLPGLVAVRRIADEYPADDVQITVRDAHHLRCVFPGYNDTRPGAKVVTGDGSGAALGVARKP